MEYSLKTPRFNKLFHKYPISSDEKKTYVMNEYMASNWLYAQELSHT